MKRVNVLRVLAMLALAPMLLGATVAEKDITTSNDVVNTARNAASFVGSWSCEASKAEELPGGQGKLVMTQTDNISWKAKSAVQSKGGMFLKVRGIHAKWDTRMTGNWRVNEGKLCVTVGDAKITPANEDARKFEEQMGRSMQDAIPLGDENCEEIVELSPKGYVTKDAKAGVLTRCTRK